MTFTEQLYQDFLTRGETELYEALRATYGELISRKVEHIVYPEDARTSQTSRIKFNCRVCQQALLHRAIYLFEGSLTALSMQNVYALALCIRGHYETTAALGYVHRRITSQLAGNISLDAFDKDVSVQLLGSKQRSLSYAPDPKNIMTQLDYADEVVDREIIQDGKKRQILRDCYEFLSELAHPNSYQWPVMPRPEGRGYKGRLRVDKGICDMIAGHYAQADRTCGLRFEVPLGVGAEVSQIPVGGSY